MLDLPLTQAEASLICDALKGTWLDAVAAQTIWLEVADVIRLNALDLKWGVTDPDGLVRRLQALSPHQAQALAEAVGAFWRLPDLPPDEGLRAAGLVQDGSDLLR